MTSLVVNEIYGPVFQGEGPDLGKPCHFLRLWGCSVQCHWCDTAYTWDTTIYKPEDEAQLRTVENVREALVEMITSTGIRRIVVSGGEPMQQRSALYELFDAQTIFDIIEIETSGVVRPWATLPRDVRFRFNVSPKLAHAEAKRPWTPETLREYRDLGARFKFVVRNEADLDEVESIRSTVGIRDAFVWIMPLGITKNDVEETTRRLADQIVRRRWNVTTRLHVLLYGSRRGV